MNKAFYTLLLALGTAILALILQQKPDRDIIAIDRIEEFGRSLKSIDNLNKELLAKAEDEFSTAELPPLLKNDEWKEVWDKDATALLIYKNGTLAFWNTADVPFTFHLDGRKKEQSGFVRLANGLYLARSSELDENRLLVVLTLIRNQYPVQNRYLHDRWHPQLHSTDGLNAYLFEQTGSIPVELSKDVVLYMQMDSTAGRKKGGVALFIWLVFFALVINAVYRIRNSISDEHKLKRSVFLIVAIVVLRGVMLIFKWPEIWYSAPLFDPIHHASSAFIPSLGDLLLNMLVLLAFVREIVSSGVPDPDRTSVIRNVVKSAIGICALFLSIVPTATVFRLLVVNSSFSLDLTNPFGLDSYSLFALIITAIVLYLLHLIIKWVSGIISSFLPSVRSRIGVIVVVSIIMISAAAVAFKPMVWPFLAGFFPILFHIVTVEWQKRNEGFSKLTSNVLVYAILGSVLLMHYQSENEIDERRTVARSIFSDEDPVAEFLYGKWHTDLINDRKVKGMISVLPAHSEDLLSELENRLQFDPWNKFNADIHVFNADGGLIAHNAGQESKGFEELLSSISNSRPTQSEGLYYKGIVQGNGGYMARVIFKNPRTDKVLADVIIDLDPQWGNERMGFPDLLLDNRLSRSGMLRPFSYARYVNNDLIDHSGNYPFPLVSEAFNNSGQEFSLIGMDGFSHLIYKPASDVTIVLSRPQGDPLSYLTVFSYLFLLYFILGGTGMFIRGTFQLTLTHSESFRNRINLAMISVITFTLLLVGLGTVMYVVKEYRTKNLDLVSEKSRSVQIEMEHKLRNRRTLESTDHDELSMLLTKFSKVFFTDINLYDLNGNLLATSRPSVFEKGLVSSRMNNTAFFEMRQKHRSEFVHQESIGKLEFLTAYAPFRNESRELMAYMSLPYFARQHGLEQEVVSLLAALINIYVLLILLAVVLALFISNRITEPLRIIRDNLRTLKLGKHNKTIEWNSNDEIGELVKEYNRTLNELVKNAELLARSERESAWREMAKQVAHEIKNPLTPMKLSIQMLERSYHDNVDDLGVRIERTAKTLIEQIDTLSNIATEFSSFAQMPKAKIERIEMVALLRSCVELHSQTDNCTITFTTDVEGDIWVKADSEQMLRVLNNLVKNATQAIPENQEGIIDIILTREQNRLIIMVRDNGTGIPKEIRDNIFVPNFTTRSSGMGLGLAMVKNIVENMGGRIHFETKQGKGTSFYVTLVEDV